VCVLSEENRLDKQIEFFGFVWIDQIQFDVEIICAVECERTATFDLQHEMLIIVDNQDDFRFARRQAFVHYWIACDTQRPTVYVRIGYPIKNFPFDLLLFFWCHTLKIQFLSSFSGIDVNRLIPKKK
jgi:hypothetical protein